jgi:hypothetical protein
MPPRLPTLASLNTEYTRLFGHKPHGNNKEFKKIKGNRVLDTQKKKREFLIEVIRNKNQDAPARVLQGALKRLAEQRKKYVNNFKIDLLEKRKITLKRSDILKYSSIKSIVEIIQDVIDSKSKNIGIELNGKNHTLSPENIKMILDAVKEGAMMEELPEIYEDSKTEIAYTILTAEEITINTFNKTNRNNNTEGAFFPHYLQENINIDLAELQIYKKKCSDKKRNLDNCLFYSLMQHGVTNEKLEKIKDMIKLKHIPLCSVKLVCDKLKIGITIWKKREDRNDVVKTKYGEIYDEMYDIGYIENHYFAIKQSYYTGYSIKNYDSVKHLDDFNMICDKNGKKNINRYINTFDLLNLMMQNKDYFFEKIDAGNINKYDEIYLDKLKDNSFECLEYNDCDYRLIDFDKTKIEPDLEVDEKTKIVYFDFETGRIKRNGKIYVEPFLCCTIDNQGNKKSFVGENCAYDMLSSFKQDTVLIAHNAKFDYTFLTKH